MAETPVEVAWFAALCDDDYEYLGIAEPRLRSSFERCREILRRAEGGGFDNILLPSGSQLGIDGVAFAAGVAAETHALRLLLAVRCGELCPPQLARQLATLDEMLHEGSKMMVERGYAESGEMIVFVAGVPPGDAKSTNVIKVHRIGDPVRLH